MKEKRSMVHILLLIAPLLIGAAAAIYFFRSVSNDQGLSDGMFVLMEFPSVSIRSEVAASPAKKAQGLSNRDMLSENEGMLFVFSEPDNLNFWMQDMRFALDFIWIRDMRVIDIHTHVPPVGRDAVVSPKEPADKVLEVNAGTIEKTGIKIGDEINIEKLSS